MLYEKKDPVHPIDFINPDCHLLGKKQYFPIGTALVRTNRALKLVPNLTLGYTTGPLSFCPVGPTRCEPTWVLEMEGI